MFDWLDPYSVKSLRLRATKKPDNPYKIILGLAADQLESKKVTKQTVIKAIEYVRTGDPTLISVGVKMLQPSPKQIATIKHLLS